MPWLVAIVAGLALQACPIPAPEPRVRIEPELPCMAGGCPPPADIDEFPISATATFDIRPDGSDGSVSNVQVEAETLLYPIVRTAVTRAVERWIFEPDDASTGAQASFELNLP